MKSKLLMISVFALFTNIKAQTTCFSSPDGIDNTWTGGWSYKEYVIPAGLKIDSVYMGATRAGFPTSQEDFIFSFCAGTTTFNVGASSNPFNYATDNNSEYNHWINLTLFNYSATGVVRVYLPVNAGAVWNNLCFATSLTSTCTPNINTGLVAQYDFTGNANDVSGNGNNGTVNGATLVADRFGNANSAYLFDGSSNYINIVNNSALNFSNTVSFSISSWIKLSGSNANYSGIVTKMDGSGNGFQFVIGDNLTLNKLATEFGQGVVGVGFSGNQNLNDGLWHQVMYIVDRLNNKVSFYVDNNLDAQVTSTNVSAANINNTSDLKIGVDRTMTDYFNGIMDDIRIYNKALSACDIDSLFNIPNSIPTGISNNKTLTKGYRVYPNPASNLVVVETNNLTEELNEIIIFNVLGNIVEKFSNINNNSKIELDLTNLNSGLYFVQIGSQISKLQLSK
jgi:hypothetical protein